MNLFALATFAEIAFSEIHAAGSPESKLAVRYPQVRIAFAKDERDGRFIVGWSGALGRHMGRPLCDGTAFTLRSACGRSNQGGTPADDRQLRIQRPYSGDQQRQPRSARDRLLGSAAFHGRYRRQEGRSALHAGASAVPGSRGRPESGDRAGNAQLENNNIELWRKQKLLEKNAGSQQALDSAQAAQRVAAAQLQSAQAQLERAQIDLDYTEIRSPIDGRIGRTSVTVGNMVGPTSGTLTTVVSQDPMYVVFSIPTRRAIELREAYSKKGGFDAVKIRLRLPDGKVYGETGKLDFINNAIAQDTDTFLLRGVISNPVLGSATAGGVKLRELVADEFVTVLLKSVQPKPVIAVPRAAVLADQQGSYVYVVDDQNIARQRRVRLGQVTPEAAGIVDGLKEGEQVVVEGIQRARPNAPVTPAPATSIASRS